MSDNEIRAGKAYVDAASQTPGWSAVEESRRLTERLRRTYSEEFAAALRQSLADAEAELQAAGSGLPLRSLEDWERLAWIIGVDPGPLKLGEILDHARVWLARQRWLARIHDAAAAERAAGHDGAAGSAGSAGSAVEVLLGEEGERILTAARSKKPANDRMHEIYRIDRRCLCWDAQAWAELLEITARAARKTAFWKTDRHRLLRDR